MYKDRAISVDRCIYLSKHENAFMKYIYEVYIIYTPTQTHHIYIL